MIGIMFGDHASSGLHAYSHHMLAVYVVVCTLPLLQAQDTVLLLILHEMHMCHPGWDC